MMPTLLQLLVVLAFVIVPAAASANSDSVGDTSLADYLESLNRQGQRIIFSSDLVPGDLLLEGPQASSATVAELTELLRPFGLTIEDGPGDSLLVVRVDAEPAIESVVPAEQRDEYAETLAEVVVTSSLRRIEYSRTGGVTFLDRELAARIPGAAEEAVSLPDRLPGVASGGISTRSHIRGGEANETLYVLDGLRLYEPFHLKDFQSVATVINASAISGMDFYSGAFPARFGDRMSAVMDISLRQPEKAVETELALSFFNASALSLGRFGGDDKGDWLMAARRGNLDLITEVVKPELGTPSYRDFLGHLGWNFGPRSQISINFLLSVDKIDLADKSRGEQATARYENQIFWAKWNAQWSDKLSSSSVLSFTDIDTSRAGTILLPEVVTGDLTDSRDFRSLAFKQDWLYVASPRWMWSFGVDGKHLDGRYVFASSRTLQPPFEQLFENELVETRDTNLIADGAQYAAYGELRWIATDRLIMDIGMRWDHQSYTTADDDEQSSPRFSILYQASENTELRLAWGLFSQAQEVNELQVSDGSDSFSPAQRAEHVVANLRRHFANRVELDVSLFRKSFRAVHARFENAFNPLSLVPELQFDRAMIDADTAESRGVEILLSRGSGSDDLFWWLGYTWSEVTDTILGREQNRSWDQTHATKLGASWRWGSWGFSAAGAVHTGWPKNQLSLQASTNPDGSELLLLEVSEFNSLRFPLTHSLDVRVSRDFDVRKGELKAFLEITNLYDRANPCCTEYALTREPSGEARLLSETVHWLPLVPSLGVVWTF
jgi:outer membrane receptor protein involved in Fe transport